MTDIAHSAFRRLDLNLLVAFDALLTELNVTRAAARVCIGQPAMSHALARLREFFEDELLFREGTAMVPTEKARTLAPLVRELLIRTQAIAFVDDGFDPARVRGQFQIALNDPLEALLLPDLMATLRRQAPGLSLSVRPIPAWQQLQRLDDGEIQLAVGYFPKARAAHERIELYRASFTCLFNPALVRLRSPLDWAELAALPHIHTNYAGDGPGLVDRAFQRRGLRRQVVAHTATPLSIPFVVKRSPLVAMLPDFLARLFQAHGDLRLEPVGRDDLVFPVSMVFHRRDQSDPLVRFIAQILRGVADGVLGERP